MAGQRRAGSRRRDEACVRPGRGQTPGLWGRQAGPARVPRRCSTKRARQPPVWCPAGRRGRAWDDRDRRGQGPEGTGPAPPGERGPPVRSLASRVGAVAGTPADSCSEWRRRWQQCVWRSDGLYPKATVAGCRNPSATSGTWLEPWFARPGVGTGRRLRACRTKLQRELAGG